MPDFWENFAGIGNAFGDFASGVNQGMAPLKSWEAIRQADLANDIQEQAARNAQFQQQAREGVATPGLYGDWATQVQTGFQQDTAKNQLGTQGYQSDLAFRNYMVSPEGQAEFRGLVPGSGEWNAKMREKIAQFLPYGTANTMGVPEFQTKVMGPSQNVAENQQLALSGLQFKMGQQVDPMTGQPYGNDVAIRPLQGGGYEARRISTGEQVQIPRLLLVAAAQDVGNVAGFNAIKEQATLQNTLQTGDVARAVSLLKAVQDTAASDPTMLAGTKMLEYGTKALTSLDAERARVPQYAFTPEDQQKAYADIARREVEARGYMGRGEQMIRGRAAQRGLRMPGTGMGQIYPGGTPQALTGGYNFGLNGTRVASPLPVAAGPIAAAAPPVAAPASRTELVAPPPSIDPWDAMGANETYGLPPGYFSLGWPGSQIQIPMPTRAPMIRSAVARHR